VGGLPTIDGLWLTVNEAWNGSAWVRDDTAQPAGGMSFQPNAATVAGITRWNASGSPFELLKLDDVGRLTTASSHIIGGAAATKWRLSDVGSGDFQLRYNQDPLTNTADNAAQASWAMRMGNADDLALFRAPPGSPASFTQQFQVRGSDGKTVCSLANASATLPMLGARSTLANLAAGSVPVNFS